MAMAQGQGDGFTHVGKLCWPTGLRHGLLGNGRMRQLQDADAVDDICRRRAGASGEQGPTGGPRRPAWRGAVLLLRVRQGLVWCLVLATLCPPGRTPWPNIVRIASWLWRSPLARMRKALDKAWLSDSRPLPIICLAEIRKLQRDKTFFFIRRL
jgi:hypothetical protein